MSDASQYAAVPSPADVRRADGRSFRRHVLYLAGYDPQGAAHYHALFVREARRFAQLWEVATEVGPVEPLSDEPHSVAWRATTRMAGATVETTVEHLRWDDLVAADFRTPLRSKLATGLGTLADAIFSGTLLRVARSAPWFAAAWLYPYLCLVLCAVLAACVGIGAAALAGGGALGWLFGAVATAVAFPSAVAFLQRTPLFAIHLLDDWNAQRRYIDDADPALDRRLDLFADRLRKVVAHTEADEVVVVGHSSGGFLAVDAMARALSAEPGLGRHGPHLALLTLGSPLLLIAFHPRAAQMRAKLARVAGEPDLFWADVTGRFDALCFPERDPLAELGLALPGPGSLRFRRLSLKRMLTQPTILRLAWRLKVFRIHFQYVMANEVKGPYDYFALLCGARAVRSQFAHTGVSPMSPFPAAP